MSGSRSISGCWTCRIRRKKCDEAKPYCSSCTSRTIPCLGYSKQRPAWMQQAGTSWQQILESEPAQALRRLAQQSYDDSRRRVEDDTSSSSKNPGEISWRLSNPFHPPTRQEFDRIWWDSNMFPHISSHSFEAQGVLNYLEEAPNVRLLWHFPPNTIGNHLSSPDRSWLYQALRGNRALYDIAVSLGISLEARSAVDENSDYQRLATDQAHHYYGRALQNLQLMIDDIASRPGDSSADGIIKKIHALSAVMHLITFEVFNHVSGAWPIHLDAGGRILGLLQNQILTDETDADGVVSLIQQPVSTEQWILLRSHATSFAWLDLVSQSTYGPQIGRDSSFYSYIPLLQKGDIDTRDVMGVSAKVWLAVNEVINLEVESMMGSQDSYSLHAAVFAIDHSLHTVIAEESLNQVQDDSSRITVVFALGALVYLHTVQPTESANDLLASNVAECLKKMEELPIALFSRVTWTYTLAGCMANGQDEQSRFRSLVTRTGARREDIGFTWKGLLVMEVCWKLREQHSGIWTWRNASQELGERVLLI